MMTTSRTITVSLAVLTGQVKVLASVTDGFYDPNRFAERVILACSGGTSESVTVAVDAGQALVIRVEDAPAHSLQYRLVVDEDPLRFLEIEARPFEYSGQVLATEFVKHRLNSVKPIARIRGYKILPDKASERERIVEFKPAIPSGARWL